MNPIPAKLASITNPSPNEIVLNVEDDDGELWEFRISRDQLFAINSESVDILLRTSK